MGFDNDKERLVALRKKYGDYVMCTNGLFHMFDKKHNELFINKHTGEIDRRGIYKTLVVLDNIVVAQVINSKDIRYIILQKDTLKCIYKTNGNMYYIDKNMVCDKKDNVCKLISHNGKHLATLEQTMCVRNIHGSMYLVQSSKMFNDKILHYNNHRDYFEDLTDDKEYVIHVSDKSDKEVEVILMDGGQYTYNFETKTVYNKFTNQLEENTNLWKIV